MVQKSRQLVSTSEGVLLRRRLMVDGNPEAVPFYPHEFIQRQSAMGLADPSALLMKELSADDLNPLERHRLREAIRKYGGDQSLLPLADEDIVPRRPDRSSHAYRQPDYAFASTRGTSPGHH